jgi:hypothetical protein
MMKSFFLTSITALLLASTLCAEMRDGTDRLRIAPPDAPGHISVTVGPDGIGRVDGISDVTVQQDPGPLPVYSDYTFSGWGFCPDNAASDTWETLVDSIPLPGPATCSKYIFAYWEGGTENVDFFDITITFYDGTWEPDWNLADPCTGPPSGGGVGSFYDYEDPFQAGCGGTYDWRCAMPPVGGPFLIQDLPQWGGWIVTIHFEPFYAPGRLLVEYEESSYDSGAGDTTCYYLAIGDDYGSGLGQSVGFYYPSYLMNAYWIPYETGLYASPTHSHHTFHTYEFIGANAPTWWCWWFGGYPYGNFTKELAGRYGMVGELTGDYGTSGSPLANENRSLWIAIRDNAGELSYEMVQVYAEQEEQNINKWFMLPFGDNASLNLAPFEITVLPFDGYVGKKVGNIWPDSFFFTCVVQFPLKNGDANYDNLVDLLDLNRVMVNFGTVGDVP